MRLPWTQKAPPSPPAGSAAAALIAAADDCDAAAAALGEALARRRAAIGALCGATHMSGKAAINRQVSRGDVLRAFALHGLGQHIGAPHVSIHHQTSFGAMARSVVDQTASGRDDLQAITALTHTLATAADRPPTDLGEKEFA